MGARVVLRLNKYTMTRQSFQEFMNKLEELDVPMRAPIVYALDHEGRPCLVAELPEKAAERVERRVRVKEPTKAQKAVREQLQGRREAVKAGQPLSGHVPAVAKNGRVLKTKKRAK